MKEQQMSVELDDEATIRRLRDEFRGVSFNRTIAGLRPPRPNPYAVAGTLLLAAATVTVALNLGSTPKELSAWSATPRAVTAADETRARQACSATSSTAPVGRSHGSLWLPRPNTTPNEPESVAPAESIPPASESLSVATFDFRGTGGVAVFTNAQQMTTCLLSTNPDGTLIGALFMDQISHGFTVPDGEIALTSRLSVTFDDGKEYTIIAGIAPSSANTVTFTGVGVETTTAFVTNGRFAAWWPSASIPTTGVVQAFDANGYATLSVQSLAPEAAPATFEAG
jgi:hypothetical protein